MAERPEVSRLLQMGIESTLLSTVPATKQFQSIKYVPDIKAISDLMVPSGFQAHTVSVISKDWTDGKLTGKPTYSELPYLLSLLFGAANITTPAGGFVSSQWQWNWKGNVLDVPKSASFENGDVNQADLIPGNVLTQFGMTFDRTKVDLTGTTLGGATNGSGSLTTLTGVSDVQTITVTGTPTGGTFTPTIRGVAGGTIAYNATAAAVQTAIQAISSVGTGNATVTGGPGPATPWVVTFTGALANQLIGLMSINSAGLTGGSTPAATPTHTTPGVAITPEQVPFPLNPKDIDIYMDTSAANLGTTQMLRNFVGAIDWSGKYSPIWPMNSSLLGFGAEVPLAPKTMADFTIATDADGATLLAAIRANTRKFMRVKWTGPIIEGTIHCSAIFDMAVDVIAVGPTVVVDGVHCRKFAGSIAHDAAWGQAAQITLTNQLLAL